jgi:Fic family protein
MLVTLFLWSRGLISDPHFYISAAIEDRKEEYIDRLRSVSADGQWTEWCIFFFQIIEAQAKSNVEIAEKIDALYSEMKEKFREVLASQWSIKALDFIFGTPVFRNSTFTAKAGIPRQTAARFSRLLSDAGLLRIWVEPAGSRPSLLAFEPLLEIVRA